MKKYTTEQLREDLAAAPARVDLGARWLDATHPDWDGRIDPRTLDMNDCQMCIIGQAVGEFFESIRLDGIGWDKAAELGFCETPGMIDYGSPVDRSLYCGVLEFAWLREVDARTKKSLDKIIDEVNHDG